MWISLLTLLLLLVTPISCRAEIRQEHGTRFRILLRIWGIPLRFDPVSYTHLTLPTIA